MFVAQRCMTIQWAVIQKGPRYVRKRPAYFGNRQWWYHSLKKISLSHFLKRTDGNKALICISHQLIQETSYPQHDPGRWWYRASLFCTSVAHLFTCQKAFYPRDGLVQKNRISLLTRESCHREIVCIDKWFNQKLFNW